MNIFQQHSPPNSYVNSTAPSPSYMLSLSQRTRWPKHNSRSSSHRQAAAFRQASNTSQQDQATRTPNKSWHVSLQGCLKLTNLLTSRHKSIAFLHNAGRTVTDSW